MPIVQGDLSFKRAIVNDDTTANGGRLTQADVGSNLFPDVTGQQRETGAIQYRKAFLKNEDADGSGYPALTLYDSKVFIQQVSPADDAVMVKAGTTNDTFAAYENNATWKTLGWAGVGYLYPNPCNEGTPVNYAAVGKTAIRVVCDTPWESGNLFFPGTVLLDNTAGTSQFVTVSDVTVVTGTNNMVVTLSFPSTPLTYQFDCYSYDYTSDAGTYTNETNIGNATCNFGTPGSLINKLVMVTGGAGAGQIRRITANTATQLTVEYSWNTIPTSATFVVLKTSVSMCAPLGNVAAAKGNFTIPNGTVFNNANVKIYAVGTIDETWTLRCVDDGPNSVWVSGAALGTLTGPNQDGSFPVSGVTTIKPANAFGQSYYFEVPYSCWGGGFLANQTVTFTTTSASKGLWIRRKVPVNANAHLNNSWELAASGDTV